MKLKEEILEIINKEIVLQSTDCPWRYAPEFAAEKIVSLIEQKLNIHGVSGKQPDYETIRTTALNYVKEQYFIPSNDEIETFIAGAQWALSQVACASGAVDKTVSEGKPCPVCGGEYGHLHNCDLMK